MFGGLTEFDKMLANSLLVGTSEHPTTCSYCEATKPDNLSDRKDYEKYKKYNFIPINVIQVLRMLKILILI